MTNPMSEPTTKLDLRPEVTEFVTRVRAQLADLDADEQQELADGLEADLADLVAEQGVESLGDPLAYARELRTAAGLEPAMRRTRRVPETLAERAGRHLDSAHHRWDHAIAGLPGDPGSFLTSIRPLWWAVRAWVAVELLDLVVGGWPVTPVPSIIGPRLGLLVLVVAVVGSVQLGRGKVWPGTRLDSVGPRTLLVALNAFAVVMTPVVLGQFPASGSYADSGYVGSPGVSGPGLVVDGQFVQNVYPYDAQGRPLTGVQLFDQDGKPLNLTHEPAYLDLSDQYRVGYPWRNGSARSWNVVPLPQRVQTEPNRPADAFEATDPPTISAPLAAVPPVSLPGIEASTLVPASKAAPASASKAHASKAHARKTVRKHPGATRH